MLIQPVILCGGSGTRLWPLSRAHYPKQFVRIAGGSSSLQSTLRRISGLTVKGSRVAAPLLICNEEHRFFVAQQADEIGCAPGGILLEPEGRGTAAALTVAALVSSRDGAADRALLMLPADHLIADAASWGRSVALAVRLVKDGRVVTFGIRPEHAETGFGYIEVGDAIWGMPDCYALKRFVEKPDAATAARYVEAGNFFWNSGMFLMRASVWLHAIGSLCPEMLAACRRACLEGGQDGRFFRLGREAFLNCPANTVDYAVMERLDELSGIEGAVVRLDCDWADIGSWDAVWQLLERDEHGNAKSGDVIQSATTDSLLFATHRLLAAIGCRNLVVVETPDAVLVADRSRAQDVRKLVELLAGDAREEHLTHRRVYRPWGSYETLDEGERFKVKRITVDPGCRLSLQMHRHRAEHWVVVRGKATVVRDKETFTLGENESTYIPQGVRHRLANAESEPLEIIEIQSGDYLGEDDIVRFNDDFGRSTRDGGKG